MSRFIRFGWLTLLVMGWSLPASADREATTHHAVGAAFHYFNARADDGTTVNMMGPAVLYDYYVGKQFGFWIRAAGTMPIAGGGSSDEVDFSFGSLTSDYDDGRFGTDTSLLVTGRIGEGESYLILGAGLHHHFSRTRGSNVSPVETSTLGLGLAARFVMPLGDHGVLGISGNYGLDFYDVIQRRNPIVLLQSVNAGVTVGVRFGDYDPRNDAPEGYEASDSDAEALDSEPAEDVALGSEDAR